MPVLPNVQVELQEVYRKSLQHSNKKQMMDGVSLAFWLVLEFRSYSHRAFKLFVGDISQYLSHTNCTCHTVW
jgi:hypothetical protein